MSSRAKIAFPLGGARFAARISVGKRCAAIRAESAPESTAFVGPNEATLAGVALESSLQVDGLIYTGQETLQVPDFMIAIALREQIELDWRRERK
jgi:hypothetical protein